MRSVRYSRSSRVPMRGGYCGNGMGRNRISKLSGGLSWVARRTGRRRKDPRTRIIFPSGRVGTAADSGLQRGPASTFRTRPVIDCAPMADATRACAAGSRGWLPLREIPDSPSVGTMGLNRGPDAGRTAAEAPVPEEPPAMSFPKIKPALPGWRRILIANGASPRRTRPGSGWAADRPGNRASPAESRRRGSERKAAALGRGRSLRFAGSCFDRGSSNTREVFWKKGPIRERLAPDTTLASRKKSEMKPACSG
jgi:hypothetical protein